MKNHYTDFAASMIHAATCDLKDLAHDGGQRDAADVLAILADAIADGTTGDLATKVRIFAHEAADRRRVMSERN